ncbi:ThiF family adenylyltransferase [Kytococcus sp. Marseille-QA3725]
MSHDDSGHTPQQAQPERRMVGPGQPLNDMAPELDRATVQRYARNIATPGIGTAGQRRWGAARVAVVGLGGLASPVLQYLAGAGVAEVLVVDVDSVELSNLQRKPIFGAEWVGRPKVEAAAAGVHRINDRVRVRMLDGYVTPENALELLEPYDVIVDCTDSPEARRVLAGVAAELAVPHVWGAVEQFRGRVAVWWAPHGPCSECTSDIQPPGSVDLQFTESGVFGPVTGQVGMVMATETLKLLLALGDPLLGWILQVDTLTQQWSDDRRAADPQCPVCRPAASSDRAWARTGTISIPDEVGGEQWQPPVLDVLTLQQMMQNREEFEPFVLLDVRGEHEREVVALDGSFHLELDDVRQGRAKEVFGPHDNVVVYCRNGRRSVEAARLLHAQGFAGVYLLHGGLMQWAREVDPDLPIW